MAVKEWISEDSSDYEKILRFNDPKKPLMKTSTGELLDCLVNEAYAYVTKKDNKLVIGLVPKVQFAVNMESHPILAGEYVINSITAVDRSRRPYRYCVEHRQMVSLDTLNHIIDLNRPDVLDPQTIFDNQLGFKKVAKFWFDHNWINQTDFDNIDTLPNSRCDLVPEVIVQKVISHAGFKRALSDWRSENWISEQKARQYAITQAPLKTIDDELSFKSAINNVTTD